MFNIVFVAVVYNNVEDTLDFVRSIEGLIKSNVKISCVIVDNSDNLSLQESINNLPLRYHFVEVLRPAANLGYFGAFNHFFKNYPLLSIDAVILCNNDLIFYDNFAEVLKSARYSKDTYVVCPDVITVDGIHQNPHVLKPRTWLQRLKLDVYFSNYYIACTLRILQRCIKLLLTERKAIEPMAGCYLHMGIGACYVLLPEFLGRIKQLEFPHFLYGEEAYLTRQVHSAGGRLYFDPTMKVIHKESATLSKLPRRATYDFGREGYWDYRTFY